MKRVEVNIDGTTLPFYEIELNGVKCYEFDSSASECPEPMVNAMAGLKFITEVAKNSKLIMINSHEPKGLYSRIENKFKWSVKELNSGKVKIVFDSIEGKSNRTDFTQIGCNG